jgi:hypothetical protein
MKIFYLCDRRACEHCSPECKYMTDVRHAVNFEMQRENMRERERYEMISEETLEFPGTYIDDERLAKIEGYLAKLVDASGRTVVTQPINVSVGDDKIREAAIEIAEMFADGAKRGMKG